MEFRCKWISHRSPSLPIVCGRRLRLFPQSDREVSRDRSPRFSGRTNEEDGVVRSLSSMNTKSVHLTTFSCKCVNRFPDSVSISRGPVDSAKLSNALPHSSDCMLDKLHPLIHKFFSLSFRRALLSLPRGAIVPAEANPT